MKLAIMQPYFFPYIGYFQLIYSVNQFVFYDDVNFIKNGWINRNRILINKSPTYITIQLNNASPNLLINEIKFTNNLSKIKKSIEFAYKKAPFYEETYALIENCLDYKTDLISEIAIRSVKLMCAHLKISTSFKISSIDFPKSMSNGMEISLNKVSRVMEICKKEKAKEYINALGGQELYEKSEFAQNRIKLSFVKTNDIIYPQLSNEFYSGLSIIDVLMNCGTLEVRKLLEKYTLI